MPPAYVSENGDAYVTCDEAVVSVVGLGGWTIACYAHCVFIEVDWVVGCPEVVGAADWMPS